MADLSTDEIVEHIEGMTVVELNELVEALEDRFGVEAGAMAGGVVAAPEDGGGAEEAEEESDVVDVVLTDFGENKIQVIKEVRGVTDLGLKEAKELVESAPKAVKQGISREDADEIKEKIESAGGTVEFE